MPVVTAETRTQLWHNGVGGAGCCVGSPSFPHLPLWLSLHRLRGPRSTQITSEYPSAVGEAREMGHGTPRDGPGDSAPVRQKGCEHRCLVQTPNAFDNRRPSYPGSIALTAKTETEDGLEAEKKHADKELSPIMRLGSYQVMRSSQRRWF